LESILNGKSILAVDDEIDVLSVLEEEILSAAPKCKFEKATTYEDATRKLESQTYDVVILDIMGVRGFDLLDLAIRKNFHVAMLTAHALTPDALKRSFEMKARAYLPKDKLGEIVPFLEDILNYEYLPGWKRLMKKLEGYFIAQWGEYWQKTEEKFWKDFEKLKSIKWRAK
jgi:CheY-like chemotaxis protein